MLIDSLYARPIPDTLVVAESTFTFKVPQGSVPSWRAAFDEIPAALPAALETRSRDKRTSAGLPLPRPIRIVTDAALREIFAPGVGDGWKEFNRRYPRQRTYYQFSPVAFSTDSLDALVYYEYRCGGRCGGGNAVWLTRRDNVRWQVRKIVTFWIS